MRHFDAAERRRRLLVRHHLDRPGTTVEQVAEDLVGLHSSDPATVVLSLRARLDPFAVDDVEDALYERRSLLRMLAMRRTMFVVPLDLAGVMEASCTQALVAGERRKLVQMLGEAGVSDDVDAWIERVRGETLAALAGADAALPASALTKLVPDLARQLRMAVGKKYEGTVGVSTRMLFLMSTQGDIVRTRPLGTWLSSQYRWARTEDWIGGLRPIAPEDARADLVGRWLYSYGPGTIDDLAWWTKWTKAQVKAALAAVGAVEVTADVGAGEKVAAWALADDLDDLNDTAFTDGPESVALLPALDPTVMGWRERRWYLGEHSAQLFDRNGNAGPTVWAGGRVVGAWAQREGGKVVTALIAPVDAATAARIDRAGAALTEWMDGVRVTPRFTSPLERELANGPSAP